MSDYRELLRDVPPKTWVALSKDETKIVGRGNSYNEAVQQADESGEDDPLLFKTPENDGLHLLFY